IYSHTANAYDLMALPNPLGARDRRPIPVADSDTFSELHGQVSPDMRWIAYDSNESGRFDVYVRPFPPGDGHGGKWPVSPNGGFQPRWRGDGKEVFYISTDGHVTAGGFEAGPPGVLFRAPPMSGGSSVYQYDVTRDGKRFFIIGPGSAGSSPV